MERRNCHGDRALPWPAFRVVFTRAGRPVTKIYNSGWKAARRRASERYAEELGRPCPAGFQALRVHDLKHTYGHRQRVAGVGFEDRKVLWATSPITSLRTTPRPRSEH